MPDTTHIGLLSTGDRFDTTDLGKGFVYSNWVPVEGYKHIPVRFEDKQYTNPGPDQEVPTSTEYDLLGFHYPVEPLQ